MFSLPNSAYSFKGLLRPEVIGQSHCVILSMSAEDANETRCFPLGKPGSDVSEVSPGGHQPWSNVVVVLPGSRNKDYYRRSFR